MRGLFVVVVLIATLVHQGTAQLPFSPVFHLSQYVTEEGGEQTIRLSASILTNSPITFTGSIEVDIAAEDISAEFWSDYIVNPQSPLTMVFTVAFQSRQANSTEHPIILFNDVSFEGRETFRLRIVEARFLGQAAAVFRAQDRLNETTADVIIEDNDFIEVNWTIAEPIEVTEGDGVEVRLRGEAFGIYANPIQIGVVCAPTQVTGVPAASLGSDFIFTPGTRLNFTDIETNQSLSIEDLVVPIINDDIAEPCESFICTLQGGALDAIRGIEPNRVTIRICDDDGQPRIIKPPEDLQVVNGATVTYDCVALAQPVHSLTWYFISANGSNSTIGSVNGTMKSIANSGKYQITDKRVSPDEYGRLLIRNVQFEDRGTYVCHARNRLGSVIASATLSVQVSPVFLSISPQVDVAINSMNDAVTLKCSVRGYPLLSLHWKKDGTPLDPDGSHINITTLRRQNPMDSYRFSTALDSSFQPIPLEDLEYFEAVSDLMLVPPIVRSDTANYTCEVESDFVQNYTVTSDNISVNVFVSTSIQLLLRPVSDCLTWAETESAAKLSDISVALSVPLQQQCGCSLSVQQSLFSCFGTTDSQTVVFLAELSYTALPGVDMTSLLTSWVTSTPHITVASTQLQVDTTCPMVIDSLQPEHCSATSVAPSTVPPADPSSNPATDSPTDATVIVIVVAVAVVVLLVMVTAIVAIVIAVIVFCSKQSKYRPGRSLPNPVHEEYEYMENESGGMVMTSMTKNPSYTTTKEMLASFTFNTEEDNTDHTYEVLPFEANEGDPDNPTQSGQEATADKHACE